MTQIISMIMCTLMLVEGCRENPQSGSGDPNCAPPYSQNSVWNVPVDWDMAGIHPQSGEMLNAFFASSTYIGTDPTQYSANVYFVTDETPLVPVKLTYSFRDAFDDVQVAMGEQGSVVQMPLPEEAEPAPGTDGQLVVINLATGEEWGLNKGRRHGDGSWSAGGAYRYHIDNSGIPPEGFGQRGAGIGQFAGIVRACEMERGYIGHAVTLAYDYPCTPGTCRANSWPPFIPPFTKTDGRGHSQFDIPEGARLVIRPEISRPEISRACNDHKGCILWVVNMQKYGGFVVDDSGHPKSYAEGDATAHWTPRLWTVDMLRNIPRDWYAVLDWTHLSTKAGY